MTTEAFRAEVSRILDESPEHNRTDEHEAVLNAIVEAFENHR